MQIITILSAQLEKIATQVLIIGLGVLAGMACFPTCAYANVSINQIFGDHMVLQRQRPVPVWGKASPGEKVAVTFAGQNLVTTTGADGRWMVCLSPLHVSENPRQLTIRGANTITISDVLVGDVWVGTGQSNMDYTVSGTNNRGRLLKSTLADFKGVRLFKVDNRDADKPVYYVQGSWRIPTPRNIMGFSAVMFYFGEELHKHMPNVPLGLVRDSVGATNLYCWIPNEIRDKDPSAAYLRHWWGNVLRGWTTAKQQLRDEAQRDYQARMAEFQSEGKKIPSTFKKPGELVGPKWSRRPSALYNGMIAPLEPFAIRGMIWYQGEWDAKWDWVKIYHDLFVACAKSWRQHWEEASGKKVLGAFPIYIVQLPAREPHDGKYWAYMREAESRLAIDVPDSGLVVTYDTNNPLNLHPHAKMPVGQRAAWVALAKEYGRKIAWHGPELKSARVQNGKMVLEFDPGSGAIKSTDGKPLRNFELAGSDGAYYPAVTEIKGKDTVVCTCAEVPKLVTVRYAFMPDPSNTNFYNSAGLPAQPFRTDHQPVP